MAEIAEMKQSCDKRGPDENIEQTFGGSVSFTRGGGGMMSAAMKSKIKRADN